MAASTTSTLSGLMPTILSDVQAIFKTQSNLFNAVYSREAVNAHTVRFQTQSVPATASAATEGAQVATTTVTLGTADATLQSYPVLARISNQSLLDSSFTSMAVSNLVAGTLANTVDQSIANLLSAFTGGSVGTGSAALGIADLLKANALLDTTRYIGTKVAILHPKHFAYMAKDLIAVAGMTRENIITKGYVGTCFGIELYVAPQVPVVSTYASSALFIREAGIGFGYHNPLVNLNVAPNNEYASQDLLGESFYKAVTLNAGAGVVMIGTIS